MTFACHFLQGGRDTLDSPASEVQSRFAPQLGRRFLKASGCQSARCEILCRYEEGRVPGFRIGHFVDSATPGFIEPIPATSSNAASSLPPGLSPRP